MTSKKKQLGFEQNLEQLEELVTRMEEGEMNLEDSLKAFEEGVKLTRLCQEKLASAEQKVQSLIDDQGKSVVEEFSLDTQSE